MANPKNAFTAAAAELADEARNFQFTSDVTTAEARRYVDDDVIVDWFVAESQGRDLEIILADTMAQRLDTVQARRVLCALAVGHAEGACRVMREALVEQVARDLAYAANRLVENYDPADSEMSRSSYASQVADPVRDDRRALARLAR